MRTPHRQRGPQASALLRCSRSSPPLWRMQRNESCAAPHKQPGPRSGAAQHAWPHQVWKEADCCAHPAERAAPCLPSSWVRLRDREKAGYGLFLWSQQIKKAAPSEPDFSFDNTCASLQCMRVGCVVLVRCANPHF